MTEMARSDGRVDNRIENYTKFWKEDPNAEQGKDNEKRLNNYTEVVNGSSLSPLFFFFFKKIQC
jgi:sterol 24-C-methyltransferase